MANPVPRAAALMSARGLTGGDRLLLPGCIAAGLNQPRHHARHDRPKGLEFIGLTALSLPARGKGQDCRFVSAAHVETHDSRGFDDAPKVFAGGAKHHV